MLPDFRFLFAAITMSMSILVFGLGAAALLRAAHEEFASTPAWHPPQEPVFAQQAEANGPVLAMLRIDAPVAEQKTPEDTAPAAAPSPQPAIISTPAETERTAALQPQDPLPSDTAKPDAPIAERPAQEEAPAPAVSSVPAQEAKIEASEQALTPALPSTLPSALPPTSEAAPAAPEQAAAPAPADATIADTKTAALDSAAATIEPQPPEKPAVVRRDKSAIKKARRARNRKLALRARVVQQVPQQFNDPFAQPMVAPRRR